MGSGSEMLCPLTPLVENLPLGVDWFTLDLFPNSLLSVKIQFNKALIKGFKGL